MIIYRYDGTFAGLLTTYHEAFVQRLTVKDILRPGGSDDLFCQTIVVETDETRAELLRHSVATKITPQALQHIYLAYLSEEPQAERHGLGYLQYGYRVGPQLAEHLAEPRVFDLFQHKRRVLREYHRFLGLVRFRQMGPLLYATIAPDTFVLPLLASHFKQRLPQERWVIHDTKRNQALLCQQGRWLMQAMPTGICAPAGDDDPWAALWRTYFDHISIKARHNPQRQQHNMPKKYWADLPEKNRPH